MNQISTQFLEFRDLLAHHEAEDRAVSAWSVGMHIQHCALAVADIARQLLNCDEKPAGTPTSIGWLVLKTRKIPRGGAQAPDGTTPKPGLSAFALDGMLTLSQTLVEQVPEAMEDAWFKHFALGVLIRDRALRFIEIHNDHHLAIIDDILSE